MKKIFKGYRKIKQLPDWVFVLFVLVIKVLKLTMKCSVNDPFNCIDESKIPYIIVTWHNRLLLFPIMFSKNYREKTYALISPSRDGQYIADICKKMGVKSVRGSTNKKAAGALTSALKIIKAKYNISITPDGPRGPRYKMSKGPIILASMSGAKILPLSINSSSYWEIKTWDRFRIPKPFCKIESTVGESISIPPNLTESEIEKWRIIVEGKLNEVSGKL